MTCACLVAAGSTRASEEEVYQTPEGFVAEAFGGKSPEPAMLWLTKPRQEVVKSILGHPYSALRIRYWAQGDRTAWVLEEIGKVKPITTGFVVEARRLRRVRVLVYRESHGWEVKYPFFTNQFLDSGLRPGRELNRRIDGIAGATLSVNAVEKLARLSLYFDDQVRTEAAGNE